MHDSPAEAGLKAVRAADVISGLRY